jgi:protein-L-isoaspartate(D-aspartate) O-methyltransferase
LSAGVIGEPMNSLASKEEFTARRRNMIDGQLRTSGVVDLNVIGAFAEARREIFVEPAFVSLAYVDREVPALQGAGRMLLAPTTLARLIQAARPQPVIRALDVAGGSGYSAWLLNRLGAQVIALETPDAGQGAKATLTGLANIELIAGDLAAGAPVKGPFDVILVNGAFEAWPEKLIGQLAEGGRLLGVDASFPAPKAVLIEKAEGAATRRVLFDSSAPRLEAFRQVARFEF